MKIKPEVLRVLEQLRFDGLCVVITGQLDRKLYTEVNKVLEACGGKWNRSAKAHRFGEEPQPIIESAINAGEVRTARDDGFFVTPPPLASYLASQAGITSNSIVLEPSAGTGNLVAAACAFGAKEVLCVEADVRRCIALKEAYRNEPRVIVAPPSDFMTYGMSLKRVTHVLMNPPFTRCGEGDCIDHVLRAWVLLEQGTLLSVLPASVKWRAQKRYAFFRSVVDEAGGRFYDLPEGSFRESGTSVSTVYVLMSKVKP